MPKVHFSSKNASKMQERSVISRRENAQRDKAFKMFGNYLLGKKTVSRIDIEQLGDDCQEFKENKKAVRVLLDLAKMRKKAIDTNNVRGYVELLKTVGFHFDQSAEALGGADNPINVAQKMSIAPEQVKEISDELEGGC
ncbi:MAG: hypothetical protein IKS96_07135 [Fibrobacter sp.]|nr:hypothetical protein [Fibrobacter sp.]MBR6449701.1 hypothetical protein [Fibrobacter sp.]